MVLECYKLIINYNNRIIVVLIPTSIEIGSKSYDYNPPEGSGNQSLT